MKKKKLSRKEREYERHKAEILLAARKVFARSGFEKATISEIAEEADFSVGTIYNFFDSKKALFDALVNSEAIEIYRILKETKEQCDNPLKRIEKQMDRMIEHFSDKIDLLRLWYDTMGFPLSRNFHGYPKGLSSFENSAFQEAVDTFAEAISKNLIVVLDPYYLALALHGIIHSFVVAYTEDPERNPLAQIFEDVKTIFFHSILTQKGRQSLRKN